VFEIKIYTYSLHTTDLYKCVAKFCYCIMWL